MKIELHCHTCRYSSCAVDTPHAMMEALVRGGYDAVFITEHDAIWTDWEIADLQRDFPQIRIFPGVELSMGAASEHMVVLGCGDRRLLELKDPRKVVDFARANDCLVVLAHPYRWKGGDSMLTAGIMPDAIEYRTCNQDTAAAQIAMEAGTRLDVPLVNASDAHSVDMVNRFWVETASPVESASDVRRLIIEKAYRNQISAREAAKAG